MNDKTKRIILITVWLPAMRCGCHRDRRTLRRKYGDALRNGIRQPAGQQ